MKRAASLDVLRDDRWLAASDAERRRGLGAAASALGPGWEAIPVERGPRGPIGRLVYRPLDVVFCLVPGSTFTQGVTAADAKVVKRLASTDEEKELARSVKAKKQRPVELAPFLLAARPLDPAVIARLDGGAEPEALGVSARRIAGIVAGLARQGMRMPTSEEWECAARGGTDAAFPSGLDEAPDPTDEAPSALGHARLGALAELCDGGVVRGGGLLSAPWQGVGEWLSMLCAAPAEAPSSFIAFRPAVSIPGAVAEAGAPAIARARAVRVVAAEPTPEILRGLDEIDWARLKVGGGKAERLPAALRGLAAPVGEADDKQFAVGRLYNAMVDSPGPVFSATAALAPFAVRLLPTLAVPERARLAWSLVYGLCNGDAEALALGIPSSAAHEARYGKGAGKATLDALAGALDTALSMAASGDLELEAAAIFLLPYVVGGGARADAALLDLARRHADPWLRAAAAYALAMGARRGGAGASDGLLDEIAGALPAFAGSLVAAARVVRDGERATDAALAACGTSAELNIKMGTLRGHFRFGGVGGLHAATFTALRAVGPRGEARVQEIAARERAEFERRVRPLEPT
ncbi:MAG TPA: hypothetical protein VGM56_26405 [Byssovorax sp.]|jgi:hypothetical protein